MITLARQEPLGQAAASECPRVAAFSAAEDAGESGGEPAVGSNDSLRELNQRLGVVRDRVRGVASGHYNGFYLFGPPGTGKTYTVLAELDELDAQYHYHRGRLTPMGLFELLDRFCDRVIVLDDIAEIFRQPNSLQLLLAALGDSLADGEARLVRYQRQGLEHTIRFTGGMICISNLEIHSAELLAALKSRVHYLCYDPSDEQLAALMLHLASKGWPVATQELPPTECREVAEFLIAGSRRVGCRLDLRLLLEKAFPDFLQWQSGETETHWKDLVRSTLEEHLTALIHTPSTGNGVRRTRIQHEQQIARDVRARYTTKKEQIAAWKEQTGKSERAFYRRLADIEC